MAKKIPWWNPKVGVYEYPLIKKVLDSNYLNDGDFTTKFEGKICKLLKVKYAVAVTSGTAALFLSLKTLNIKQGDEVIIPDVGFIATANAVEMCGAKPVLVDIDPETLNISPASFLKAITKKTKAVIPVHVSGRHADIETVCMIAKKNNLSVVEDAAEAFMSKYNGKYLGTFGQLGCLSFSPNKTITTGQGGIILTNDNNSHKRLIELKDQGRPTKGTGGNDIHPSIGYNFKFTNLQAAVGLAQLKYLNKRIMRMRKNYYTYLKNLEGVKGISMFNVNINNGELPLWIDVVIKKRDHLAKYLRSNNVECREFWFPIHSQKPYRLSDKYFPNSTKLSPMALWLPSAFTLKDSDIKHVCILIKKFINEKA